MSVAQKSQVLQQAVQGYGDAVKERHDSNRAALNLFKGPAGATPFISESNEAGAFRADELVRINSVCETPEELATAQGQNESFASIFNNWKRISLQGNNPVQPAIPAELLTWQLDPGDILRNNTNSSTLIGFISPEAYGDYVFEAVIKSTGNDDDWIGLAAAYTEVDGIGHTLTLLRSVGGGSLMGVAYDLYGPNTAQRILFANGPLGLKWADGVVDNTRRVGGPEGGVNNYYGSWAICPLGCRVRVTRANDVLTFETSDIRKVEGDSDAFVESAKTIVDLNSDPRLAIFKGAAQIGYVCASQPFSTWETIQRPQTRRDIIDNLNKVVWRWNGTAWINAGSIASVNIEKNVTYFSPVNSRMYYCESNGTMRTLT